MKIFAQRKLPATLGFCALLMAGLCCTVPTAAQAQEMLQLTVPAPEYTLGNFRYKSPQADGWRQMANNQIVLSLVYAQQKSAEDPDSLDILFGVTMEVSDIPESIDVEGAAALADLSRKQMAEARKDDIVGVSAIEAVPGVDNMFTYRLLVHAPVKEMPDAYEVYYVLLSADKKQYLVIQCITKAQDYGDQLYFMQFYGSLASFQTGGDAAKPAEAPAEKPAADKPVSEKPATAPAPAN